MKIAIIGAGPTGLMAGYELVKAGHQVKIFEGGPEYGGLVSTIKVGGVKLEKFYHHIFTSDFELIKLTKELKLASQIMWRVPQNGIYLNGRLYSFTSPLDLLFFTELPLRERVAMGLLVYRAKSLLYWQKLDKITAEEWVTRNVGSHAYEKVWGPLLRSKFADDAHRISAAWIWNKFKLRGSTRSRSLNRELLGYMEGSFMELYERMIKVIRKGEGEIYLGEMIKKIVLQSDKTLGVSSQGRKENFDRVILTVAPEILRTINIPFPEGFLEKLNRIRYKANICMILELSKQLSPFYWMTVAEPDAPFVAIIEHTNLFPAIEYGGHIVYLSRYIHPKDELYNAPNGYVEEVFLTYLKKIFPKWDSSEIKRSHITRAAYAQPVVTTDYAQNIPDYRTPVDNLFLASMAQIYPEDRGQNYALRLGRKIAEVVQETP